MNGTSHSNRKDTGTPTPAGILTAEGNPFSTRHVRPGALEFIFSGEASAPALVARLREDGWRGEIVGPHGSGKSTLLATLLPLLEKAGRKVMHFALHAGEKRLPDCAGEAQGWNGDTQVVIDGYEQLSWWARRWIDHKCRASGAGLLVTSHESVGLPALYQTAISLDVLQAIVVTLLPPGPPIVSPEDVAQAFQHHGPSVRESLFALYDLYEQRRRE